MTQLYQLQDQDEESNTTDITLEELEKIRSDAKEIIELADAAKSLSRNPDFIKVIMTQYFQREPSRLGELVASGKLTDNQVSGVVNDLKSIGSLNMFLRQLLEKGKLAEDYLADCEQAYNEHIQANS